MSQPIKHKIDNIFDLDQNYDFEKFEEIISNENIKIERIISSGQQTPEGEWYDQKLNEWVMLLSGSAVLLFEENMQKVDLNPGDHINIPSHCRHRVEFTDKKKPTVWLAVHYK